MDLSTYVSAIDASGAALTAACRQDPGAAVAACPAWDVAGLTTHVGGVHGWAAAIVGSAAASRPDFPTPPAGTSDVAGWADSQRASLLSALAVADPTASVWVFGQTGPAEFWWRRQTHETTVHAWDGCTAVGVGWSIPADVATDGVDEFLTVFVPRMLARADSGWGLDKTVHFHRTDGDGEWLVPLSAGGTVTRSHGKGDLAVRGSAQDLLLWVTNRPATVELLGDTALAEGWAANIRF